MRRKNGIIKTRQATRKNTEPNMAQKLPTDAMINPTAETQNKIQPMKFMEWSLINAVPLPVRFVARYRVNRNNPARNSWRTKAKKNARCDGILRLKIGFRKIVIKQKVIIGPLCKR